MKITKVGINEDGHYEIEFLESLSDENIENTYNMTIENLKHVPSRYESAITSAENIQQELLDKVSTIYIYLANKTDRALFYETARFIVEAEELPVNVKMVNYPGSAIILLEFGTLGIGEIAMRSFQTKILHSVTSKVTTTDVIERPEIEEPKVPEIEVEEDPFPIGGAGAEFVDEDDDDERFNLGVIEEGPEEEDNNG